VWDGFEGLQRGVSQPLATAQVDDKLSVLPISLCIM
jgi:hypothetical protein